jgi:hypothetical protein
MNPVEELFGHIRAIGAPDKTRILRVRALVAELADAAEDRARAQAFAQRLNGAYLVLQLAALSDDPVMIQSCRRDCAALVLALNRARAGAAAG